MVEGITTQRRRRTAAWVVCLVWLLGVELLPNLHLLAHHHDDHSHDASGTIVTGIERHGHDHGERAAAPHQHATEAPHDWDDVDPSTPDHAAAGLAHRAVALHQPPPPLLAPLPVELASWWIVHALASAPSTIQLARPTARGPPATA